MLHQSARGRGADGQHPGDLLHHRHVRVSAVLDSGVRRRHRLLEGNGFGSIQRLHRGELRLQPGRNLQPFQPDLIPPLKHVNTGTNAGAGSQGSIFEIKRIESSNRGTNTLQSHLNTTADSHSHIMQRGTDIQSVRGSCWRPS
ncbi:hypothetical protein ARTHRO8AJ_340123 [Arthrobacter sp. 8AJ]|nr:hypothetical protein ARTHRO8AJ_340123 [Arthrobacter sp. 8AJ]